VFSKKQAETLYLFALVQGMQVKNLIPLAQTESTDLI
jgi:hypothetical protein